jgi:hypothetical protein
MKIIGLCLDIHIQLELNFLNILFLLWRSENMAWHSPRIYKKKLLYFSTLINITQILYTPIIY